eukprot:COSAG02_NODE_54_length_43941_cov_54.857990_29_plen_441_part_00
MAGRPAAGVPSPESTARLASQLRRGKGAGQWTYPSEGSARRSHPHARQKTAYAGVEQDVVPSLHPCPWTMRVKEPRICYDGVHGLATTPPTQQSTAPSVQARNLEHQWSLDELGGEAEVAAHDTHGPIGHGCDSPTGKPKHARKSTVRYAVHIDGTYIPLHDTEPKKSVSWATDVQRPSRRVSRSDRFASVECDQNSTTGHSTAWSRATDDMKNNRADLAGREAGWVDSLREHRSKSAGAEAPGSLEPDEQSEEVAPVTETSSVGVIGHPLFDMLAAVLSAAPAPTPEEVSAHSRDNGGEQPWWDDDSDDEERKDYPKPWRENMNLRSVKPKPRTPDRNPLAHLQTETDDRDRSPGSLNDQTDAPVLDIFIKRAMSMPGGSKLRHKREVIQENSPWRWSAEREREARQKSAERSDSTVGTPPRSRRSTSPGGSPVCGGAA